FSNTDATAVPRILNEMIYPSFFENHEPWASDCLGEEYLRAAHKIIKRKLDDPTLSPPSIAKDLGISTSYLYILFKRANIKVNQLIIEERLNQCRDRLSSPIWSHASITDI